MSPKKIFLIEPETLELLQTIERSEDEPKRVEAIKAMAASRSGNAARILQETFERSVWRSTKLTLLQALGDTRADRAVEFLCKIASNTDDLGMAGEAILALGCSESPVAGEFLASVILDHQHPLTREALIAIANLNWFPCDDLVASIVLKPTASSPTPVLQNAIIAAGLRRQVELSSRIEEIIFLANQPQTSALFNTALIAAGRLGGTRTLEKLEAMDTRFRSFAHQIKTSAMESIRLRGGYSLEDAVSEICNGADVMPTRPSFQMLKAFPAEAAREAFDLLAPDASLDVKALLRLFTASEETHKADIDFLVDHSDGLSQTVFASLGRALYMAGKAACLDALVGERSPATLSRFLGCVYTSKSEDLLFNMIENCDVAVNLRFQAINSLTAIPVMQVNASEVIKRIGKRLTAIVEQEEAEELASRMIRALGQIRYIGADALTLYRRVIKEPGNMQQAVYAALCLVDSQEAATIICKRLKQIVISDEHANEVSRAVESLAKFSRVEDGEAVGNLRPQAVAALKVPLLKIMGTAFIPKLSHLIDEAMDHGDFQQRLLAVAAAKGHMTGAMAEKLINFLTHADACLRGRSLDSLTAGAGAEDHDKILTWLELHPNDSVAYSKLFRSLTPKNGDKYTAFLAHLEKMIVARKGAMNQTDIIQAAMNLRDNLIAQGDSSVILAPGKGKAPLSAKEQHAIDETLKRELTGFGSFTETIKSVLRSSEVICQHPELFDARVDKSTVLLQYVKSIDLLLQERLGSAIFLQPGSDLLQKMQSRIVRLELDDDGAFGSNLMADLQLSLYFSRETFPAHKLGMICKSIMSGQLVREQYKVIDGLRAWALLLLLFGRNFKFRNIQIEALLPMAKFQNDGVAKIARDMNELQEARNRAAHRGTMLEMGGMTEMRAICASVLNSLDAHLIKR
jgi:hypothetical protein